MTNDQNIAEYLHILTDTEKQILILIAQNKTSKEISEQLFISHRTVQNHRYNISQKLNLKGPNKLLEFALNNKEILSLSFNHNSVNQFENNVKSKSTKLKQSVVKVFGVLIIITLLIFLYFSWIKFSKSKNSSEFNSIEKNRIAVMPFRTIGSENIEEYIADGLTEELINQISQISELRVIARSSVMQYKNKQANIRKIAEELNVDAVLEGSIQKEKDKLRIRVQLVETSSRENLWVKSFNRTYKDILKIQQEISWQVAVALEVELFLDGLNAADKNDLINTEAQTAYLKGKYFVNQNTGESLFHAQDYFKEAIKIDSNFAKAWAGLADSYTWLSNYGFMPPAEAYTECRKAAFKAIELKPDLGEAYTALASVALLYDWDFKKAEVEFTKAIEINPSDVIAHRLFALLMLAKGKPQKALEHTKITIQLDPLSAVSNAIHGRTYYFAGKYQEAIKQFQNTLEIEPKFWLVHSYLGEVYLETGKIEKAIAELQEAQELAPDNFTALARLGYGYARTGNNSKTNEILKQLIARSKNGQSLSFQIVLTYTALGEIDKAFEWMYKAYQNRHDYMLDLRSDPKLNPLRQDVRFDEFIKKMNL